MSGYHVFAQYYDRLTQNVDYRKRAAYFDRLMKRHGNGGSLLLDLACGTGSLSIELAEMGYDVIGADASCEMLSMAACKTPQELRIQYLCQPMQSLDLYGTVDACVCALDSINHITSDKTLLRCFERVALFLNPDGVFVFDANTPYKHEHILADNAFVYECDPVFCVWQNTFRPSGCTTDIRLDFFEQAQDGGYRRSTEEFAERGYSLQQLTALLEAAGLAVAACYGADTTDPPRADGDRMVIVAKKKTG